ncbi:MAG: chorismate--pyruvate lyase family protein [Leptospirillia bacterium]
MTGSIQQQPLMMEAGSSHRARIASRLDISRYTPILRTLLTTDGTVTEVLAAYHGEEVGVAVLAQHYRSYEGKHNPELAAPIGIRMLERDITLLGKSSGRIYAAAHSRIIPSLLPPGMQEGLLAGKEPLGKLMLDHRLESFREIVSCGRSRVTDVPALGEACVAALGIDPEDTVVWRTYRVISGGRPIMSITEYFPEVLE